MTARSIMLSVLLLVSSIGLSACDNPSPEPTEVGSGNGPTGGEGATHQSAPDSSDQGGATTNAQ